MQCRTADGWYLIIIVGTFWSPPGFSLSVHSSVLPAVCSLQWPGKQQNLQVVTAADDGRRSRSAARGLAIMQICATTPNIAIKQSRCRFYIRSPPRGAASGMSRCHFFGWLFMSLLSFYHVQSGWNFNILESDLAGVHWPEELTIYGPGPDLWPLKFWP